MLEKGCNRNAKIFWEWIPIWPLILSPSFSLCTIKLKGKFVSQLTLFFIQWKPSHLFVLQMIFSPYYVPGIVPGPRDVKVKKSGGLATGTLGNHEVMCSCASLPSPLTSLLCWVKRLSSYQRLIDPFLSLLPKEKRDKSPLGSLSVVKRLAVTVNSTIIILFLGPWESLMRRTLHAQILWCQFLSGASLGKHWVDEMHFFVLYIIHYSQEKVHLEIVPGHYN